MTGHAYTPEELRRMKEDDGMLTGLETRFGFKVDMRFEECVLCEGRGTVKQRKCKHCGGTGTLPMASSLHKVCAQLKETDQQFVSSERRLKRAMELVTREGADNIIYEGLVEVMFHRDAHAGLGRLDISYEVDKDRIGMHVYTLGHEPWPTHGLFEQSTLGIWETPDPSRPLTVTIDGVRKLLATCALNIADYLIDVAEEHVVALGALGAMRKLEQDVRELQRKAKEIRAPKPKKERKKRTKKGCTAPHCYKASHVWDERGRPWCKKHGYERGLLVHEKAKDDKEE